MAQICKPNIIFDSFSNDEWWLKSKEKLQQELAIIGQRDKLDKIAISFFRNNYPQGKDFCIDLINEQINNNGMVHVIHRRSNYTLSTWFYFKF